MIKRMILVALTQRDFKHNFSIDTLKHAKKIKYIMNNTKLN